MFFTNGKAKNKAVLQAAKTLAAAVAALGSAAEALIELFDDDEEEENQNFNKDATSSANDTTTVVPILSVASILDPNDSDDEYMALARKEIRVATSAMSNPKVTLPLDSISEQDTATPERPSSPVAPQEVHPPPKIETIPISTIDLSQFAPGPAVMDWPSSFEVDVITPSASSQLEPPRAYAKVDQKYRSKRTTSAPVMKSWEDLMVMHAERQETSRMLRTSGTGRDTPESLTPIEMNSNLPHESITYVSTLMRSQTPSAHHAGETGAWEATETRVGTPNRLLFTTLIHRWPRPTNLQVKMLNQLRTGVDMLLCYGNLKSQIHAILVRCVGILREQPSRGDLNSIISVLIIVPEQTTGRRYLYFANELMSDFGLPHKAMLLPGGESNVVTEAERMMSEQVDILISSPRVFVKHVNRNPFLSAHLANLRLLVFVGAHDLTKTEIFLNLQLNAIKKRMPTRAKRSRQIIITTSTLNDQVQTFATRALAPNSSSIISPSSGDDLQEMSWSSITT